MANIFGVYMSSGEVNEKNVDEILKELRMLAFKDKMDIIRNETSTKSMEIGPSIYNNDTDSIPIYYVNIPGRHITSLSFYERNSNKEIARINFEFKDKNDEGKVSYKSGNRDLFNKMNSIIENYMSDGNIFGKIFGYKSKIKKCTDPYGIVERLKSKSEINVTKYEEPQKIIHPEWMLGKGLVGTEYHPAVIEVEKIKEGNKEKAKIVIDENGSPLNPSCTIEIKSNNFRFLKELEKYF